MKKRTAAASGSTSAGAGGSRSFRDSPASASVPAASGAVPGAEHVEDGNSIRMKQEHAASNRMALGGGAPGGSRGGSVGNNVGRVSIARDEWDNVRNRLREMEKTITNLRVGLDRAEDSQGSVLETGSVQSGDASSRSKGASPEREGIHAANTLGEGTVHLGSRSVLAYILNNKSGSDQLQALLEGGILPKLGLDNESATYPFVDLWSSDMSTFDISAVCSALPGDQQCKEWVSCCSM